MKRSSWASGSGYVPSYSMGFCVAMTMNGRTIGCVTLSIVACRSSMHSRRLAWVFGEDRLISSASTMLAKIGPGRNSKLDVFWSKTLTPSRRSGGGRA